MNPGSRPVHGATFSISCRIPDSVLRRAASCFANRLRCCPTMQRNRQAIRGQRESGFRSCRWARGRRSWRLAGRDPQNSPPTVPLAKLWRMRLNGDFDSASAAFNVAHSKAFPYRSLRFSEARGHKVNARASVRAGKGVPESRKLCPNLRRCEPSLRPRLHRSVHTASGVFALMSKLKRRRPA